MKTRARSLKRIVKTRARSLKRIVKTRARSLKPIVKQRKSILVMERLHHKVKQAMNLQITNEMIKIVIKYAGNMDYAKFVDIFDSCKDL